MNGPMFSGTLVQQWANFSLLLGRICGVGIALRRMLVRGWGDLPQPTEIIWRQLLVTGTNKIILKTCMVSDINFGWQILYYKEKFCIMKEKVYRKLSCFVYFPKNSKLYDIWKYFLLANFVYYMGKFCIINKRKLENYRFFSFEKNSKLRDIWYQFLLTKFYNIWKGFAL